MSAQMGPHIMITHTIVQYQLQKIVDAVYTFFYHVVLPSSMATDRVHGLSRPLACGQVNASLHNLQLGHVAVAEALCLVVFLCRVVSGSG